MSDDLWKFGGASTPYAVLVAAQVAGHRKSARNPNGGQGKDEDELDADLINDAEDGAVAEESRRNEEGSKVNAGCDDAEDDEGNQAAPARLDRRFMRVVPGNDRNGHARSRKGRQRGETTTIASVHVRGSE